MQQVKYLQERMNIFPGTKYISLVVYYFMLLSNGRENFLPIVTSQ